jgi:transposase InsO family protein
VPAKVLAALDAAPGDAGFLADGMNRVPWRSFEAVEFATLEWVDWFNSHRLLEPIGPLPPAEAEARYYAQAEAAALALRDTSRNASGRPGAVQASRQVR